MANTTFRLAATGDAILAEPILERAETDSQFHAVVSTLREADAAVTNFETLVPGDDRPPAHEGGLLHLRSPPAVIDDLVEMGCSFASAGTNHSYDYTHEGIRDTMVAFESHGMTYAGLGRNLADARRPAYRQTPGGRVALVSATTSIPPESEAGRSSPLVPGRPGINPLHVEKIYRLHSERIDQIRAISEATGESDRQRAWKQKGLGIGHDWDDESYVHFDDKKFETVEDESEEGVRYAVDQPDCEAILSTVREASTRAEWVVATLHSHQGTDGQRNMPGTPDFLVEFAHACVDAGADAFVTTGPHVLRGMEVYDGKPIFYSLGNFFLQLEQIDRFPAETYRRFGVTDERPSALFDRWFFEDGQLREDIIGDGPIWETVLPVCTFVGGQLDHIELVPCWLQESRGPSSRGIPVVATGDRADAIVDRFASLSAAFDTTIDCRDGRGIVDI
ncbi:MULTISPECIES: CapA family protein [Salinibaculum]|uniref:CapA family protein n=1 Tax=Salinibaculum TaxID=2732368 RepID=UPI0030CBB4C1